jgi:parvulin-like peptidyl-prolyl isomerase
MSIPSILHSAAPTAARTTAVVMALLFAIPDHGIAQTKVVDPVAVVVNGVEIRESDIRLADEEIGRNLPSQDTTERREAVITMLIDTVVLSAEAAKQRIGNEAELQRRMNFARKQGLMNELLLATAQRAATEDNIRKTYDTIVEKSPEIELHLRQIVFKATDPNDETALRGAREKADTAAKRIASGEDFAKVAAELSDDPNANATGGDYGWRTRNELAKEYAEATSTLKIGDATPPFKTAFGLHIVKFEDQRTRQPPEFSQVHDRLKAMVMRNAQLEIIQKLRAEAKIDRKDQPRQSERQKDNKS